MSLKEFNLMVKSGIIPNELNFGIKTKDDCNIDLNKIRYLATRDFDYYAKKYNLEKMPYLEEHIKEIYEGNKDVTFIDSFEERNKSKDNNIKDNGIITDTHDIKLCRHSSR